MEDRGMDVNDTVWIRSSDIDLDKLAADLAAGNGRDPDIDLRIASMLGVFDRYASNMDARPEDILLAHDGNGDSRGSLHWRRDDRFGVQVRIVNKSGTGGIMYMGDLPAFTASLDRTMDVLKKVGVKSGGWHQSITESAVEARIDMDTEDEGVFKGAAPSLERAFLVAATNLVAYRRRNVMDDQPAPQGPRG